MCGKIIVLFLMVAVSSLSVLGDFWEKEDTINSPNYDRTLFGSASINSEEEGGTTESFDSDRVLFDESVGPGEEEEATNTSDYDKALLDVFGPIPNH